MTLRETVVEHCTAAVALYELCALGAKGLCEVENRWEGVEKIFSSYYRSHSSNS